MYGQKRILFVNAFTIDDGTATGNTVKNIFKDYDKNKILQLCTDYKNLCANYTVRTLNMQKESYPVSAFVDRMRKKENISEKSLETTNAITRENSLKNQIHNFISGFLDASPIVFSAEILKAIDEFQPEVIYTCAASIRILKIVNRLAKRYGIKVIVHLMDDWPETVYTTSAFSLVYKNMILRLLKKANENSVVNFAISPSLAEKYEKIYNHKYLPLMNPASFIADDVNVKKNECLLFVYAGSIELNRWKSLIDIGDIIKKIPNADFEIYIPHKFLSDKYIKLFSEHGIKVNGYVPQEKTVEIYQKADVLVHIESFEENVARFTKHSLSTKLTEYMGSGTPVFAYIPETIYAARYLKERDCAAVCTDKAELMNTITSLCGNDDFRRECAEKALKVVINEHSSEVCKEKIRYTLNNIG